MDSWILILVAVCFVLPVAAIQLAGLGMMLGKVPGSEFAKVRANFERLVERSPRRSALFALASFALLVWEPFDWRVLRSMICVGLVIFAGVVVQTRTSYAGVLIGFLLLAQAVPMPLGLSWFPGRFGVLAGAFAVCFFLVRTLKRPLARWATDTYGG